MAPFRRICAGSIILACFFSPGTAHGEQGLFRRVRDVFEGISRRLNDVGERAEGLLGEGLGLGDIDQVDFTGLVTVPREINERYPSILPPLYQLPTNSVRFGWIRGKTKWSRFLRR